MTVQIIIFGASGDLTARKLIPALVNNERLGALAAGTQIIGVSRSERTDDAWRDGLLEWLGEEQARAWEGLRERVFYVSADALRGEEVERLLQRLDDLAGPEPVSRLFYLALKPSLFAPTVAALGRAGALRPTEEVWRRVVVEKPFGTDLATAQALNQALGEHLEESQIFRIDHYLGKETVQNILAFRFQNAIFEPLWNREHIESVEITVSEAVGMEGNRGAYYDEAGALRDMVQNHMLQLLALVAMEPPGSMSADDVRSEKVKVLRALGEMSRERVARDVVRAQYLAGPTRERGYLEESGVGSGSTTETYVAIRARVQNWRWSGVPFLLRTGKCMERRYSEIILRFRTPPLDLWRGPSPEGSCPLRPNALRLIIQPEESIRLSFLVKEPGSGESMRQTTLRFDYDDLDAGETAPAYQRLLLDALEGNATLFIRDDDAEAAWRFADSIREGWEGGPVETYEAGGSGPERADDLFRGCEGIWGDGT